MSELSFQQQAVLWGQAYEVLVKRGVLAVLLDRALVTQDAPALAPWRELKVGAVTSALTKHLQLLDETEIERVRRAVEHLAVVAFGLGYTAMREYLKPLTRALELKQLSVRALWCPLQLPGPRTGVGGEMLRARTELNALLGIDQVPDPARRRKGRRRTLTSSSGCPARTRTTTCSCRSTRTTCRPISGTSPSRMPTSTS